MIVTSFKFAIFASNCIHCQLYCSPLLECDVKIDGHYFQNTILSQMLLPKVEHISGKWYIL